MAKRNAANELNDRNWDEEDEPEEAGVFKQASDDVIKHRQIKVAKRRNPENAATDTAGAAFTGFGGFAFKPLSSSTPLNFGAKLSSNGLSSLSGKDNQNNSGTSSKPHTDVQKVNGSEQKAEEGGETEYLTHLKVLNESVLSWIKAHVEKTPYCILTPIFNDYERHLRELENDKAQEAKERKPLDGKEDSAKTASREGSFGPYKFGTSNLPSACTTSTFSKFGNQPHSGADTMSIHSCPSYSGFSFKTTSDEAKPAFSFNLKSAESKPAETAGGSQDKEDEYVPPKPEVTQVEEEGSTYTKRCKLFYQKDGAWVERGVGNIHLKSNDDKTQLLVRADTNLGNILLNIMLTSSIPLKRQGKNNISLVCVPNPPVDPKADSKVPVSMLIRVKTEDDADELLDKMKESCK